MYGPLLVHERVDLGLAMLSYTMVSLWSKGRHKFADFLPPWMQDQVRASRTDDAVVSALGQMLRAAENGGTQSQPSRP